MKILVTGGAGYIGSHTIVNLLTSESEVFVVDNLSNGSVEALQRVELLTNRKPQFLESDILDGPALRGAFERFRPDAVVHFAGSKAVGESVADPLKYYRQNVAGTLTLLEEMSRANCRNIVFSSSATVYGDPQYQPYDENHPTVPINPYGKTKLMVEEILRDWAAAQAGSSAISLRYFNPVGAHQSGMLGEDPKGIPNNLMPFVSQVAVGTHEELKVFGNTYDTRDGTGERDYIHVMDLAQAHVNALLYAQTPKGFETFNIGTGSGTTVLELVKSFEAASGKNVPYKVVEARDGDLASYVADPSNAHRDLQWKARFGVADMCRDSWKWQQQNPTGYST